MKKIKENLIVTVTSKSIHKTGAVEKVFKQFPELNVEVRGIKTKSGINEQPVNQEALEGALNRIISAISLLINENFVTDLFISIESGIFELNDIWVDKAVVVIFDPQKDKYIIKESEPVEFPLKYVQEANRRGFDEHTVGSVITQKNPESDPTDPHAFLTKDQETPVTREELLINTVYIALLEYFEL